MKAHKVPETLNQSLTTTRNKAMHELCDLSSAKQARIASEEEAKRPLGNRTKNTLNNH
jgi:hypothetical protein